MFKNPDSGGLLGLDLKKEKNQLITITMLLKSLHDSGSQYEAKKFFQRYIVDR